MSEKEKTPVAFMRKLDEDDIPTDAVMPQRFMNVPVELPGDQDCVYLIIAEFNDNVSLMLGATGSELLAMKMAETMEPFDNEAFERISVVPYMSNILEGVVQKFSREDMQKEALRKTPTGTAH